MTSKARHACNWLRALSCLLVCTGTARAYDWLPATNKIVLLAVWAHADDEGIFGGGSLPYYSSVLSMPTMIVCMCPADPVRYDELRCAAWSYGVRYEPVFGDFSAYNSGLNTNTAYGTNTINLTWDYWADGRYQGDGSDIEAGKARAINFVAEQIRRYRPDVVITHDLNGETGHDNHKATAYAVTQAFSVAADPNATATNLVALPPWQAQKLYVHFYPSNRLFHTYWETPYPALSNQTPHQAVDTGLTCHVSQGPYRWSCASVYPPWSSYYAWPSEWWGLYASTVGPDTVLSSNLVANGYTVPAGVAAGDFLEHLPLTQLYLTVAPRSGPVGAGSSITLIAAATTTAPPLTYQWRFNGTDIAGATAARLTLNNVQPSDAGSYTVVAIDSSTSVTSAPAVLTVLIPPTITTPPQTRTNLLASVARFSASASGSDPLSYQWVLNGVNLQDGANIHGAHTNDLQIDSVQLTNSGNLVLVVSNLVGAAAAPIATLIVEVPPPCQPTPPGLVGWWTGEANADDLTGNNNGTLLGNATAGLAGRVGRAFGFDGTNSAIQIPDSPQLKPANLTIEAWVLFSALDSAGSGGSPPGEQYIIFKQNSRSTDFEGFHLGKARTVSGDVFSFMVSSAAGQALSLYSTTLVATGVWYHVAGVRGPDYTELYVNGQRESRTNVSFPQDYGTNPMFFGSSGQSYWDHKFSGMLDEVSFYGRALSPDEILAGYAANGSGMCWEAVITAQPQNQTLLFGSDATFSVTALGLGLSYQWFFNGTNALPGATNNTLALTKPTSAQAGRYSVLVSNFTGAFFSQPATLALQKPPGIIMPLRLSGTVGSSWRIDYVNELFPSNAWTPLATVTLTNSSQVYYDSSALLYPHRFYRLIPLP